MREAGFSLPAADPRSAVTSGVRWQSPTPADGQWIVGLRVANVERPWQRARLQQPLLHLVLHVFRHLGLQEIEAEV